MKKNWQEVSILIAGCGSIGKRHTRILKELRVKDISACDPVESQRRSLLSETPDVKMYADFERGLEVRPDAVLIATPPDLHVPMAKRAIEAGCHVLIEKPVSDTTKGLDEFQKLIDQKNKKVMVALCFRYHEGLLLARKHLESGAIGRLVSIRALMGEYLPEVRPDYENLFVIKQGGAFDLMHDIDLAIWYAGKAVSRVYSLCGVLSDLEFDAPDVAEILIDFNSKCFASVHLDFFQRPRRRQIELIGTEGVIIVEFARWDRCTVSTYRTAKGSWTTRELMTDRDDMFRTEDREFLQTIVNDRPVSCTIAEAGKSVEVVERAQRTPL